jgi:tRNA/tmRNA/rRNA uracil-C5-methylase (TrmA/RlmC/RlmD family)
VTAVHARPVEAFVTRGPLSRCDLVVLDPPRTGARRRVIEGVARWEPSRLVYVACDPASLARDVATAQELGYELRRLRSFDVFPMTAHVETVALLVRAGA